MKTYNVNQINSNELEITGKVDSPLWENAELITEFNSPWDNKEVKKIEFKSLWDNENLYFSFIVSDSDIHIHEANDQNTSINNSDRVELFFRVDQNLSPYYCLEIDPFARIMDFKALPNKDFDFNWNWPNNDINVISHISSNRFSVEGSISLKSLKNLNLLNNSRLEVGVYRAKYNKQKNMSFEPTWITWIDPKTSEPNFHIESSFGVFELVNSK